MHMAVIDNSPSLPIPELTRYRREVPFHRGIEELANYIDFEAFRPKLEELCHYGSKGMKPRIIQRRVRGEKELTHIKNAGTEPSRKGVAA